MRNKVNSRFYIMPLQRFLSLRNSANGILEGKIVNIMFWGEGYGSRPTQEIAPGAGAVTHLHTIGVRGYFSSVQPPPFRNSWTRPCIKNLVSLKQNSKYGLQSTNIMLQTPSAIRTLLILFDCAFSAAATYLWNSLPIDIREEQSLNTSEKKLETHLFRITYLNKYFTFHNF